MKNTKLLITWVPIALGVWTFNRWQYTVVLESLRYPVDCLLHSTFSRFDTIPVTHELTPKHADIRRQHTAPCIASRGKKWSNSSLIKRMLRLESLCIVGQLVDHDIRYTTDICFKLLLKLYELFSGPQLACSPKFHEYLPIFISSLSTINMHGYMFRGVAKSFVFIGGSKPYPECPRQIKHETTTTGW